MKKINNGELNISNVGNQVNLKGWVANKRKLGGLTFIDLRDRWGVTQVISEKNVNEDITKESIIEVLGKVQKRKDVNTNLDTGEIEIQASEIILLSKSESTPFVIRDELEAKEDTRLKHRYLDLRRPTMTKKMVLRHKFIKALRDFLDDEDFLEIETPLLSKSTPEGARDYLVPTRDTGHFFALPQSPQLYKQLLMSSGIEKYFQIVKCFRDEDLRSDRQPEFTQLDMEMSFINEEAIRKFIEKMLKNVFKKIGFQINNPFQIMEYDEALDLYGSDKPDLRFDYKLINVLDSFKNTKSVIFKNAQAIKMIAFDRLITKSQIKKLEEIAKKNGSKGLLWASRDIKNQINEGPGFKIIPEETAELFQKNNIETGTLLFISGDYKTTVQSLGAVRSELNKIFNLAKDELNFSWIINWPCFEKNDQGRYVAAHHPFTSPSDETIDSFDKDPASARAKAYDLVLNGYEIGGGSLRISDLGIQKRVFSTIGMSDEETQKEFGFFLEAFKYGMPPHGGIAFGIDRILAIITNSESIREVIAFPKNANGIEPMSQSPSKVSEKQLDEYGIKLK